MACAAVQIFRYKLAAAAFLVVGAGSVRAQSLPPGLDLDIPAGFGGPQIDTHASNDGADVVCDAASRTLRVISYSSSAPQIRERQVTELLTNVLDTSAGNLASIPLVCNPVQQSSNSRVAPAALSNAFGKASQLLAVGDFNGDGLIDAAVADSASSSVAIYLGNSDGTFQNPVQYPTAAPAAVIIGDWNGDGILDLAVAALGTAAAGPGSISVLIGNGDGTFRPAVEYPVGNAPRSLAVGDFNADGQPDLAVANSGAGNVSILLGNGDGTFQPAVEYPAGSAPVSIVVADF